MVELLLALLPTILSIIGFILKERYSEDGKKKREAYERDRALAKQDSATISKLLSNGLDRLRKHNKGRGNP